MKAIVVVERPAGWPLELPGVEIVAARAYLTEPRWIEQRRLAVYNLCRDYGYQSLGYYVSLLAEARGHRPLPGIDTLRTFGSGVLLRNASDELDDRVQSALKPLRSDAFDLSIYFGRNTATRYDRLASALFNMFPAPLLRASFLREEDGRWRLTSVRPLPAGEIPEDHKPFVVERASAWFARPKWTTEAPSTSRFDLAILWSERDEHSPSDEAAIRKFERAFDAIGIGVERICAEDIGRLGEFDALFIRETTAVNHHTYRFARRAEAAGLVVIDDAASILRCGNKVFQTEAFRRSGIGIPPTLVVHAKNRDEVAEAIGFPCVLKSPDGAFSQGVSKVSNQTELDDRLDQLLDASDLVVAQGFVPTDFDWRIGLLNGAPLWACRYHMARGHWQIIQHGGASGGQSASKGSKPPRQTRYGRVEAVRISDVPTEVLSTARRAAALMGDGLYGVDLKATEQGVLVIEVNDNPNIDAGLEDGIEGAVIYEKIARWFEARIQERTKEMG